MIVNPTGRFIYPIEYLGIFRRWRSYQPILSPDFAPMNFISVNKIDITLASSRQLMCQKVFKKYLLMIESFLYFFTISSNIPDQSC